MKPMKPIVVAIWAVLLLTIVGSGAFLIWLAMRGEWVILAGAATGVAVLFAKQKRLERERQR